ncbi:hypothetical protein K458DRAFT_385670 [Lentithecium fluviatile CBS 122367]|uniref:Uncharacterized protein n=1 Tax=Lentithecium fluviatile CBS 122367 TaxID=1168545 RepID=A0A6G1JD06_9PLEO|nr:hypothetical protein K458DRAFT_385670 [Lentithecium fluviatile CBS 122367]
MALVDFDKVGKTYSPSGFDFALTDSSSTARIQTAPETKHELYHSPRLSQEPPKKGINADLSTKELLLRFFAIAAAGAVISADATGNYWVDLGHISTVKVFEYKKEVPLSSQFGWLQFAAKLHEVFMQLSISFILMYYLHNRLPRSGIPFSFLDSPCVVEAGGWPGPPVPASILGSNESTTLPWIPRGIFDLLYHNSCTIFSYSNDIILSEVANEASFGGQQVRESTGPFQRLWSMYPA